MKNEAMVANAEIRRFKHYMPSISGDADVVGIDLMYPPYRDDLITKDEVRHVEIDICAVRATDSIRVHYNFERNGWVVEQASRFVFTSNDGPESDSDWQEVAFVESWGRQESREQTIKRTGFDPDE